MAMGDTITNLRNFVAARQADPKVIETGRKETPLLSKSMAKKKILGGSVQELSVRNGEQSSNAKFYQPGDSATDFVGTAGSANVYQAIDPVVQLQFYWSFLASNLRYSDIELQIAKTGGASKLADYLGSRMDFTEGEARETAGAGIISGTGDGYQGQLQITGAYDPTVSTYSDPYGLIYQDRNWSAGLVAAAGTAMTDGERDTANALNTHFGQGRELHSELVGNHVNAAIGFGTTVAVAGATLTQNSNMITVMTGDDYRDYLGWEIWVNLSNVPTASGGTFTRLGREFVVAGASSNTGATTLLMSSTYRGATDTTVAVELRAPFSTDAALSNAKLNKFYYQASDGGRTPDMALSSTATFAAVSTLLFDQHRWTRVVDSEYGTKGYDNFKYLGATWCADNNYDDGTVHFINTEYTRLCCLQGQDDYKIKPSDIQMLSAGQTGHSQYGADTTFAFQMVSSSPRSNALIIGMTI